MKDTIDINKPNNPEKKFKQKGQTILRKFKYIICNPFRRSSQVQHRVPATYLLEVASLGLFLDEFVTIYPCIYRRLRHQ